MMDSENKYKNMRFEQNTQANTEANPSQHRGQPNPHPDQPYSTLVNPSQSMPILAELNWTNPSQP